MQLEISYEYGGSNIYEEMLVIEFAIEQKLGGE